MKKHRHFFPLACHCSSLISSLSAFSHSKIGDLSRAPQTRNRQFLSCSHLALSPQRTCYPNCHAALSSSVNLSFPPCLFSSPYMAQINTAPLYYSWKFVGNVTVYKWTLHRHSKWFHRWVYCKHSPNFSAPHLDFVLFFIMWSSLAFCVLFFSFSSLVFQYNSVNMKNKTAEEVYVEMLKPAETVTFKVQHRPDDFSMFKDAPGDGFYIRCVYTTHITHSLKSLLGFYVLQISKRTKLIFPKQPHLWPCCYI